MATTFTLTIRLGNEAMQTAEDVAFALDGVAQRLHASEIDSGTIRDGNGNTVGEFSLSGTDDE